MPARKKTSSRAQDNGSEQREVEVTTDRSGVEVGSRIFFYASGRRKKIGWVTQVHDQDVIDLAILDSPSIPVRWYSQVRRGSDPGCWEPR